ncbi:MAG: hypothetical protein DWQ05_22305 [Calditrichaeota bacterium]|nr:MAG: hypothetical protein DWQ05_22305 [Calditrichota bacterium]
MTILLFLKACLVWLLMMVFAVGNGLFRDNFLASQLNPAIALPLSGITLSILILLITYFTLPILGKHPPQTYIFIGAQWVLTTLAFEFIFGHFVAGKPWPEILQIFKVWQGNFFLIALVVTFIAPVTVAKLRDII